jgi:hypothetical protein
MAENLKKGGGKKAPKKKKGAKAGEPAGNVIALDKTRKKNTATRAEAVAQFDEIFELHRELNASSAEIRKRIGDAYATAAKKLDLSKKSVKHLFKLEKFRRENEAAEREFDSRDRESFELAAQMLWGTPFGEFAAHAASLAKKDGFGGKTSPSESD